MEARHLAKLFVSGLAFPATILPILYTILYWTRPSAITEYPLQFIPLFLPLIFGFANIACAKYSAEQNAKQKKQALWVTGIVLGLLIACLAVFKFHVPVLVFGMTSMWKYFPLIMMPIVYGLIFRYIVNYLNQL